MTYIEPYQKLLSYFKERNKNWRITQAEEDLLQLYIGHFYSVYDIRTYLESVDLKNYKNVHRRILNSSEYKNIHRRVKKLRKLKLIEDELSHGKSIHGAKYYKLSEKGLCYILLNTSSLIGEYVNVTQVFKLLHINYPDNFIFRLFLEPYVDVKTIERIYGSPQVASFWRYLRKCCEALRDLTNSIGGGEQVFVWADIKTNKTYKLKDLKDKRLAEFLKNRFSLDWLDLAHISKFDNDNMIKIFHQNKSVTIELVDDKTKALLKINKKERLKMNVTMLEDQQNEPYVFDVCAPPESFQQIQQIYLEGKMKSLASGLVVELLSKPIIENDINVLAQDTKFVKLLKRVKQDFDDRYNSIIKMQST